MAIKGKKKSQSRGSQARRRPAAAPRPAYTGRSRPPWHRTPGGQVTVAVILAALFGLGAWAVIAARSRAASAEETRARIDGYTNDLRGLIQSLDPPVGEMAAVPLEPTADVVETLEEAPDRWIEQLTEVEQTGLQITPPAEAQNIHPLFGQMISLYKSAASTYKLVPRAEPRLQRQLLRRAAETRDQATGVFFGALSLLDEQRRELDMGTARLEPPGAPAPQATPAPQASPLITVPVESGNEGGGGNGGKGKNAKKGGGG